MQLIQLKKPEKDFNNQFPHSLIKNNLAKNIDNRKGWQNLVHSKRCIWFSTTVINKPYFLPLLGTLNASDYCLYYLAGELLYCKSVCF